MGGNAPTPSLAGSSSRLPKNRASALSQRMGGDDMAAFSKSKDPWVRGGALETDTLEDNDSRVSFNVTRCRYAEMYRELGMADLGGIFSCGRDGALSNGFNPSIKLARTQTIMEGASHCDFRYTIEKDDAASSKGE